MRTLAQSIPYIIINDSPPKLSAFCIICEFVIGDSIDTESTDRAGCCRRCELDFFEINREKWEKGWRPSKEEVELSTSKR